MDIQEKIEEINQAIIGEITKRTEAVAANYNAELIERDRIIAGLKTSLAQAAKDFNTVQLSGMNGLVNLAHKTAKDKGWWDKERTAPEIHMLIVSEIAEATEASRVNNPENEQEELGDAVIRIMDYFGHMGWNLDKTITDKMTTNLSRSYRHGDKRF